MEFTIDELFLELFKKGLITQVKACTVISVDETNDSCVLSPNDDSADLNDVRLNASIADKTSKMVVYPKEGSVVLAGRIQNLKTQNYICAYSEIDKIKIIVDDTSFVLDTNGIVMNGGTKGGLVNKDAIITIAQFCQAVKNTFSSWNPVSNDGGAALKFAMNTALSSITIPNSTAIENTKIKHG